MKWVNIAAAESALLVFVLSLTAPRGHRRWPILGGTMGMAVTYSQYLYAKSCGIRSSEPATETFDKPPTNRGRMR